MNDSCSNCNNASCYDCTQEDQYKEFTAFTEFPVGSTFKIENDTYKVVSETNAPCNLCDFDGYFKDHYCDSFLCSAHDRKDGLQVIAILYDQEEEDNA